MAMKDETYRGQALIGIAGRVSAERQHEVLAVLADTPFEAERIRRLAAVRPVLSPSVEPAWHALLGQSCDAGPAAAFGQVADVAKPVGGYGVGQATRAGELAGDEAEVDRQLLALLEELRSLEPPGNGHRQAPCAAGIGRPAIGLPELTSRLDRIEAEMDRFEETLRALGALSGAEQVALLERIPRYLGPAHQDEILARSVALLPASERSLALPALGRIRDAARLRRLVEALLPQLAADSWPQWHALFGTAMREAGRGDRRQLLGLLEVWAPVIARLGGDRALLETIEAIDDAGSLWP
jgi:hypothetical protein